MRIEIYTVSCPTCRNSLRAAEIATALPDEIVFAEAARRNGKRQTPHAGPGRPTVSRCPGCEIEMGAEEMRDHRTPCIRQCLIRLWHSGLKVRLSPKEPDPYPDFRIESIENDYVIFQKLSSQQRLEIELTKIAEIMMARPQHLVNIRLLGRLTWKEDAAGSQWCFVSSRIGRPRTLRSKS